MCVCVCVCVCVRDADTKLAAAKGRGEKGRFQWGSQLSTINKIYWQSDRIKWQGKAGNDDLIGSCKGGRIKHLIT